MKLTQLREKGDRTMRAGQKFIEKKYSYNVTIPEFNFWIFSFITKWKWSKGNVVGWCVTGMRWFRTPLFVESEHTGNWNLISQ